jgi:hypothetical protein
MTSEEAQQAQDVVLGMFLASSHPATVFFNSGASHSFISSSFVAKHNPPIATMKHTMLVSSPGGQMRTRHIFSVVSITIRGVDFPSNFILLDSKGIDVILGMDWLRKYDGVIQCARNAVRLTKRDGTAVEFVPRYRPIRVVCSTGQKQLIWKISKWLKNTRVYFQENCQVCLRIVT